jgi:hypothetical protein
MPEVIYREVRNESLEPGHERGFRINVDVRGAQQVSVYARSTVKDEDIKRIISFGSDTGDDDTYAPLCEDTFGQTEHLWASVPVYGPMLQVQVTCGQTATVVDMTIYAVREVS